MEQIQNSMENLFRSELLVALILAACMVIATAICARVVRRFMIRLLHLGEDKTNLPVSSIFLNIARAVVWILGICIMLSTCFNVDVSAAVTALGIGGIAVSLGCQDTISNLIGGLQLSLMRLIKPGDSIEVGSSKGTVEDITWRHTTIRNADGEEVIIPNSVMSKTALTHLPSINEVTVDILVNANDNSLDEVASLIEAKATEAVEKVAPLTKKPKVTFSEVVEQGFKGSVAFCVADSNKEQQAADVVVRAIAPFARKGGFTLLDN